MKKDGHSPNAITYACLLAACTDLKNLEMGKYFHSQLAQNPNWLETNSVHNALVAMYLKCGETVMAKQVSSSAKQTNKHIYLIQ
jgi:hypothetical protein